MGCGFKVHFKVFAVMFGSVTCVYHPTASLGPGWLSVKHSVLKFCGVLFRFRSMHVYLETVGKMEVPRPGYSPEPNLLTHHVCVMMEYLATVQAHACRHAGSKPLLPVLLWNRLYGKAELGEESRAWSRDSA